MFQNYLALFKEQIIVSIITTISITLIVGIYNILPVYLKPFKILKFLKIYKNIQIKLSQIYYFNVKEKSLDWKSIEKKLDDSDFEFTNLTPKKNYIDLVFKNSTIMFRLGEREHNKNENCFFIKMLTPIKKRAFIGKSIKDIQEYLKKLNSILPFNKDEEHTLIGEIDLISKNKKEIELKYRKDIDGCELSITKEIVQVVCPESKNIETKLKKGIFKQMDLMLK